MEGTASAGSSLLRKILCKKITQDQKKTPPRQATCLHSHVPEHTLLHIQRAQIIIIMSAHQWDNAKWVSDPFGSCTP